MHVAVELLFQSDTTDEIRDAKRTRMEPWVMDVAARHGKRSDRENFYLLF